MPGHFMPPSREATATVKDLRERLGLFSFDNEERRHEPVVQNGSIPELDLRPGVIVEWLMARPGAGALTSTVRILSRCLDCPGACVIVDPVREFYVPALTGWGINPNRILLLRPATLHETCWVIEQCLRCPGVSVTWACIDKRLPTTVHRRWKMAAEAGGGVGLLFRPDEAQREPVWADLRLRVTPLSGGQGDARRIRIDVLYRRGGLGGSAQVWEIDHAAGDVHLVPEVANPTAAARAAGA
jgi:protein ImuA